MEFSEMEWNEKIPVQLLCVFLYVWACVHRCMCLWVHAMYWLWYKMYFLPKTASKYLNLALVHSLLTQPIRAYTHLHQKAPWLFVCTEPPVLTVNNLIDPKDKLACSYRTRKVFCVNWDVSFKQGRNPCVCILMSVYFFLLCLVTMVPGLQKNPQPEPRTSLWVQTHQIGERLVVPSKKKSARLLKSRMIGVQ